MTGPLQSHDRGTEISTVSDEKVIREPNKRCYTPYIDHSIDDSETDMLPSELRSNGAKVISRYYPVKSCPPEGVSTLSCECPLICKLCHSKLAQPCHTTSTLIL